MPGKRVAADAIAPLPQPPRSLPPRWVNASSDSLSDASPTSAAERVNVALPAPSVYNVHVAGQTYQVRAVGTQDGTTGTRPKLPGRHGSADNLAADTHDAADARRISGPRASPRQQTPPQGAQPLRVPKRATPSPTVTPLAKVLGSSGSGYGATSSTPRKCRPGHDRGGSSSAGASVNTPPLGPSPAPPSHFRQSTQRENGSSLERGRDRSVEADGSAPTTRAGALPDDMRRGSVASVATNASSGGGAAAASRRDSGNGASVFSPCMARISLTPPTTAGAATADSPMSIRSLVTSTVANSPSTGPRSFQTPVVAALTSTMRQRSGGGGSNRGLSTSLSADSHPSLESSGAVGGSAAASVVGPPSASPSRRRRDRADGRLFAAALEGGRSASPRSPSARRVHFILDDDAVGVSPSPSLTAAPASELPLLPARGLEDARAAPFSPHRTPLHSSTEAEARTTSSANSSGATFAMSSSGELGMSAASQASSATAATTAAAASPLAAGVGTRLLTRTSPPLAPMSPLNAPSLASMSSPPFRSSRKDSRAEPTPGVLHVMPSGQLVLSGSVTSPGSNRSGSADSYVGAMYQPEQPLPKPALKLISRYSSASTAAAADPTQGRGTPTNDGGLPSSSLNQLKRWLAAYLQGAPAPAPQQRPPQAQRRTRASAMSPYRASGRGSALLNTADGAGGSSGGGVADGGAAAAASAFSSAPAARSGGRQQGMEVVAKWSLLGIVALVSLFLILVATATD